MNIVLPNRKEKTHVRTKKCTNAKTKYSPHIQSLSNVRKLFRTEIENIQDFCIKKTQ